MKKYDALYIFVGVAKNDVLEANLEKALAEVTRLGGTVVATEPLGKRAFARQLDKNDSGVYVKVRIELDPSKLEELTNRYHLVEEVFRVQFLSVDERREARIAAERQARADIAARRAAARAAEIEAKIEQE